jgi:hypothetical protein
MKNIYKVSFSFLLASILCISFGGVTFAQTVPQVQTNYATNMSNGQVTLNGYLSNVGTYGSNYVYFQWGPTTNYGGQSTQQNISNTGAFSQIIGSLNSNTIYHFRAVAQNTYGTVYGQDMTFYSSGSGYYGTGTLTVDKQAMNLSSGNLIWQTSANASPSDIVNFVITLKANGNDVHNVIVHDNFPSNLIYKGKLTVNTSYNYSGDLESGLNIGTIYAGQTITISYQAQVAPAGNFGYGASTLTNIAVITSNESGAQTDSVAVTVNKSQVSGASTVSTGLTNNFFTDSFFLPLFLLLLSAWLYFSGKINIFANKLKTKLKK